MADPGKITHRFDFKMLASGNAKLEKGSKKGYVSTALMLAPAWRSRIRDVCPFSTPGCRRACLNTSGQGGFGVPLGKGIDLETIENWIQKSRRLKTELFYRNRGEFFRILIADIEHFIRFSKTHMIDHFEKKARGSGHITFFRPARKSEKGLIPCVRLNGTSDLLWESFSIVLNGQRWPNLMALFPRLQFYDYTKWPRRFNVPANYCLNFSWSEAAAHPANARDTVANRAREYFKRGVNTVVVFEQMPETFMGYPVIDGMQTDLRFLDPRPRVVGLLPLKFATEDETGFVVKPGNPALRLRNPARAVARDVFYEDSLGLFPDE